MLGRGLIKAKRRTVGKVKVVGGSYHEGPAGVDGGPRASAAVADRPNRHGNLGTYSGDGNGDNPLLTRRRPPQCGISLIRASGTRTTRTAHGKRHGKRMAHGALPSSKWAMGFLRETVPSVKS